MTYKWLPVFETSQCTGCGACLSYCVAGSIRIVDGTVVFKDPEDCLSEGNCVRECPMGGIRMDWRKLAGDNLVGIVTDNPVAPPRQ